MCQTHAPSDRADPRAQRLCGALQRDGGACTILIAVLLSATGLASAAEERYESPPVLTASRILPSGLLSGQHYRVDETVHNDGYMNSYTIKSDFGQFQASSTAFLRIRIHEIDAIAAMSAVRGTDEFGSAAAKAGTNVMAGAKNLVTNPVGTLEGAVTGVASLFQRAGESLSGGDGGGAEGSRWQNAIGFSKTKREIAQKFGVDVYSSNAVLQKELDDLAWAQYAGGMSLRLALAAIPGGAGVALSMSSSTQTLNDIARQPPEGLRRMNREKLQGMGVAADTIDLFLDNAAFSPTRQTLLVHALGQMSGVADRGLLVKSAIPTASEEQALFRQRMAQMYAGYHRGVRPIQRFLLAGGLTTALTADGALVLNLPLDYVVWTRNTARIARAVTEQARSAPGVTEKQLWITGELSPLTRRELERQGWKIHDRAEQRLLGSEPLV
jgi:hypothetical protein